MLMFICGSLDKSSHVETVVLLSHKKPDSRINVKAEFGDENGKFPIESIAEKAEEYKPKEKVTYKMIQIYIKKRNIILKCTLCTL